MNRSFDVISGGRRDAFASSARILLGLFVLITGIMKFFVPEFRVLFTQQLSAAGIPLQRFSLFFIPMLEGVAGAMLIGGVMTRLASLFTVFIMGLIAYMDLVVDASSLFPPVLGFPIMPIVALVLSIFLYFVVDDGAGGDHADERSITVLADDWD